jgi:SAM-dependent methyltransferase
MNSYHDPAYAAQQYRDAGNLNARIALHQQCSTNPYGWMRWVFDHFRLSAGETVLEVGCGSGALWTQNLDRLPADARITLTDFSPGMVAAARSALGSQSPFTFQVAHAQALPFAPATFDVVIANHMLYHVPDIDTALRELRRVLRTGGRLYASTVGRGHLQGITDLVRRFDPAIPYDTGGPAERFGLENGATILGLAFDTVRLHIYEDALHIADTALLAEYVGSMLPQGTELAAAQLADFRRLVETEIARKGHLRIEKAQGMFEAQHASR